MPITNNLVTLQKGLKGIFMDAFAPRAQDRTIDRLATSVESDSDKETYGWLGAVPSVREWLDERQLDSLADHEFEIVNSNWEVTISVDRNMFKDDKLNGVDMRVKQMGIRLADHPNKLLAALKNDNSILGYDGQPLYSANHQSEDEGVQDNTVSQTGTSEANIRTDVETAIARMREFVDGRGEPFWVEGEIEIVIHAPPRHAVTLEKALLKDITTGDDNVFKGIVSAIIIDAHLTANDTIYVENVGGVIRAIIWQTRQGPETAMQGDESSSGFMTREWAFGVDARWQVGVGLWQATIRIS